MDRRMKRKRRTEARDCVCGHAASEGRKDKRRAGEGKMILLTGGAGFIGSHLVEAILGRGERVRILDDFSTGKKENLEEALGIGLPPVGEAKGSGRVLTLSERAELLVGDISDFATCQAACRDVSFIFHQAALGSVPRSVEDPLTSHRINATGTLNLLRAAQEAKVKRLIYASSSSVYGDLAQGLEETTPKKESLTLHPQSPYAATKLIGEVYCRIFSSLYRLETVSLRYFNVFGPRQDPQSVYAAVVPKFMKAELEGVPAVIYGDGKQSRDFTFVANVVEANLLARDQPGISGGVFNVAAGQRTTVIDLLSQIQEIGGRKAPPRFEPARSGDIRHSLASIDRAREDLDYEIRIGLQEGLRITWDWFRGRRGR
jgi:nucleoside-diphosphate-sugar epimerase